MPRKNTKTMDKDRAARGREYIRQVKMSIGQCQMCGLECDSERLHDFHFDHIDPQTKSYPVGRMATRKTEIIKVEIDKCQLLCRDCHMKRTSEERHYLNRRGQYTPPSSTDQLSFDL